MNHWTEAEDLRLETRRLITSRTLKRCDFCGAVNSVSNLECFVCRWHGHFDESPEEIEIGVNQLVDRCPELVVAMLERTARVRRRQPWWQSLVAKFAALIRR